MAYHTLVKTLEKSQWEKHFQNQDAEKYTVKKKYTVFFFFLQCSHTHNTCTLDSYTTPHVY